MSNNYTVTVSAEALCELLLAAYAEIDYDTKPYTSKLIEEAQEQARELLYSCGYWNKYNEGMDIK